MGGTSIRIFLPDDGDPQGLRLVSKSLWTGQALVCSRTRYLDARIERSEFRTPGVYVLAGRTGDAAFETRIYVGESENPRERIDAHAGKDFWSQVIMFTSKDTSLNKASIRYLESRLITLARAAARAEMENSTAPPLPVVSEEDQADLEAFLEDMLVIYPLMGLTAFEPREQLTPEPRLYLVGQDAKAEGALTEDGFLVFAGARARMSTTESMPNSVKNHRQALIDAGIFEVIPGTNSYTMNQDRRFGSPSAAAGVMLGRGAPGPLYWKDAAGTTLKQLTDERLSSAAEDC